MRYWIPETYKALNLLMKRQRPAVRLNPHLHRELEVDQNFSKESRDAKLALKERRESLRNWKAIHGHY